MTHAAHLSLEDLEKRRTTVARRASYGGTVVLVQTCPKTRAGAVVVQMRPENKLRAYLFRPTQINRYYADHAVASAHEALGILAKIDKDRQEKAAAKIAPHTLQIGDIMVETMGATMMRATFYKVVAIPHPRKVTLITLDSRYESGDWMAGQVVPVLPTTPEWDAAQPRWEVTISMQSGGPEYRANSITCLRPWKGHSISVYSD